MSAPIRFDELVVALGREFKRRRMGSHAAALRTYFRRRRHRAQVENLSGGVWDENTVVEWLAILRIAPFDRVYPVHGRAEPCPLCRKRGLAPTAEYLAVFPGGSQKQCMQCKTVWLVAESSSFASARGPGSVEQSLGGRKEE